MAAMQRKIFLRNYCATNKFKVAQDKLYKPCDSDVIVIGPPKSGTTWLQQILHQLRTKGDESFTDIYSITCFLANPNSPYEYDVNAEQICNPRIYKHHEAYGIVPTTKKQKKIVIFRDPYDTSYSFSKFMDRLYGGDNDMTDSDASQMMTMLHEENKSDLFSTAATWWRHRMEDNILIVFYEDLKINLAFEIRKIAKFVEIALSDQELEKVVHFCSFDYMSKHKEKFSTDTVAKAFAKSTDSQVWKTNMSTVREDGGKIGDGSKIGPKLRATVDSLWTETMCEEFGFETYGKMFAKNSDFALLCKKSSS